MTPSYVNMVLTDSLKSMPLILCDKADTDNPGRLIARLYVLLADRHKRAHSMSQVKDLSFRPQ